ncbi:hypothetical protein [Amycolatopsis sp. NPDC059021]|uniref:hypothetical protein n=1 Tax=Amycolatopsis sp. NPDC059021 TaxID=3346704 RepID=UPI00366DD213
MTFFDGKRAVYAISRREIRDFRLLLDDRRDCSPLDGTFLISSAALPPRMSG